MTARQREKFHTLFARAGSAVAVALVLSGAPRPAEAYTYVHKVVSGDTLGALAKRYQTRVSVIKKRNRLRSTRLHIGQKLRIVTKTRSRVVRKARHRVRRGETLARIAKKHRMSLAALRKMNPRVRQRRMQIGSTIWVAARRRGRDSNSAPVGGVKDLIQLTSGPGYEVHSPSRAWGTFLTVTRLMDVIRKYAEHFPEAQAVQIRDISKEGGGRLHPHRSHRLGRDVDLKYPLRREYEGTARPSVEMIDLARTWFLVKGFTDTSDVTYVFMDRKVQEALYKHALNAGASPKEIAPLFQYPHRRSGTVIRDEPGHDRHFHVRFRHSNTVPPPVT